MVITAELENPQIKSDLLFPTFLVLVKLHIAYLRRKGRGVRASAGVVMSGGWLGAEEGHRPFGMVIISDSSCNKGGLYLPKLMNCLRNSV